VLELSGADVVAAIENGVSAIEDGGGRFPHVSGMTFAFDASKPAGARVAEVMVGGAPIDLSATYRLATNDFIARGGDGYAVFADKPSVIEATAAELMAAQVIRAFETGAALPVLDGRVARID
ncbi:MAG: 5'-nucleotidase C-terminal domain-containing protein, partial [Pseudomonadota bacterium]